MISSLNLWDRLKRKWLVVPVCTVLLFLKDLQSWYLPCESLEDVPLRDISAIAPTNSAPESAKCGDLLRKWTRAHYVGLVQMTEILSVNVHWLNIRLVFTWAVLKAVQVTSRDRHRNGNAHRLKPVDVVGWMTWIDISLIQCAMEVVKSVRADLRALNTGGIAGGLRSPTQSHLDSTSLKMEFYLLLE